MKGTTRRPGAHIADRLFYLRSGKRMLDLASSDYRFWCSWRRFCWCLLHWFEATWARQYFFRQERVGLGEQSFACKVQDHDQRPRCRGGIAAGRRPAEFARPVPDAAGASTSYRNCSCRHRRTERGRSPTAPRPLPSSIHPAATPASPGVARVSPARPRSAVETCCRGTSASSWTYGM